MCEKIKLFSRRFGSGVFFRRPFRPKISAENPASYGAPYPLQDLLAGPNNVPRTSDFIGTLRGCQ